MLNWLMKQRELLVEKQDVMRVVEVINNHLGYLNGSLGNCGWANKPDTWFISIYASQKQFAEIVVDLKKIGQFDINVRPGGQIDLCFKVSKEES